MAASTASSLRGVLRKPWRLAGSHASVSQQGIPRSAGRRLSARRSGSYCEGVEISARCLHEDMRLAGAAGDEVGAFRRRQGDDDRAVEQGIEIIKEIIAERNAAANAKVVEGEAVPSLPPPVSAKNS